MGNRTPRGDLEKDLQDPEYRDLYGAADAKAELGILFGMLHWENDKGWGKVLPTKLEINPSYLQDILAGEANPTIGKIGTLLARVGLRLVLRTAPLLREEGKERDEHNGRQRYASDIDLKILCLERDIAGHIIGVNTYRRDLLFAETIEEELQSIGDVGSLPVARMLAVELKCISHTIKLWEELIAKGDARLELMQLELKHLRLWRDDVAEVKGEGCGGG